MNTQAPPQLEPQALALAHNETQLSLPQMPNEVILHILLLAIDQPAVYNFNIDLSCMLPHPPITTSACKIRFHPIHSHPSAPPDERGTWEPQVSKNIRALMGVSRMFRNTLTSRLHAVPVPTASNPFNKVWFNPAIHIICLNKVAVLDRFAPTDLDRTCDVWVKQDSELWTELNFDIQHLGFLWRCDACPRVLAAFNYVFPALRKLYSVVIDESRPDHLKSQPLEAILQERHTELFSPMFLYMAKRYWLLNQKSILDSIDKLDTRFAHLYRDDFGDAVLEGVVLR